MPHITVANCSGCPFARHLDGDRYVCTDSATNRDVVRGHWEVGTDCQEKLEALEAIAPTQSQIEAVEVLNAYEEVWGVGRIYTADEISEVVTVADDGLVTIAFNNGLTKTFAQTEYDYLLMVNEPEPEIDYAAELKKRAKASDYGESFLNAFIHQETQAERNYFELMRLERLWWEAIIKVENSAPGSEEEAIAYSEVEKAEAAIKRFNHSVNIPCLVA